MPLLNITPDSESDVMRGINYHRNLPKSERDELRKQIDSFIHIRSSYYPLLNNISSLPDYEDNEKIYDFPDEEIEDDENFEDEFIKEEFDPIPDLGIEFD